MSVYNEVTQAIIAELEQWVPPWVKSWQSHLPRNFISRKEYRGVNVILLWVVANKKGYRSPYWLTFKQAGEPEPAAVGEPDADACRAARVNGSQTTPHTREPANSFHSLLMLPLHRTVEHAQPFLLLLPLI